MSFPVLFFSLATIAFLGHTMSIGKGSGCCIECHFDWEEEHVWPYLPDDVREKLQAEHDELKAAGYPPAAVLEHSEAEMPFFRRYCPQNIVDRVEADHAKLEPRLKARL